MAATAESSLGFHHVFEPGSNPEAPTLLVLHGTGGDEHDLLPLAHALAPGASVLSPRGKVLERGAPRFFRRIAEGVFDQADLAARTTELNEFINAACLRYSFELSRLVAVGFSNGANIAASLILKYPQTLGGALLLRAMVPFTPATRPALRNKPILLLAGISDPIVAATEAESLEELLSNSNADVELRWVDAGHALSGEDVQAARQWLQQFYR
ncbi:MAG: phospholipase/Carboxylesterase [Bryobacterales bacterium]|nr:phospholipase/Carboxylesterase [Bryobacterales bacterium]